MRILQGLLPILLFLSIFIIGNLYFVISPVIAILPAIILSFILSRKDLNESVDVLIAGMGEKGILMMCMIFLLSGAFATITKNIGSVDNTVQLALDYLPTSMLLPGIFIVSAFLATAMGTSMGTIAAILPVALGIAEYGNIPLYITSATVIGGSMFGDNLSIISDTTIASVQSQGANLKEKFKLNAYIALASGFILIILLSSSIQQDSGHIVQSAVSEYQWFKIIPYLIIILLAAFGFNVFVVLIVGILSAGIIGMYYDYSIVTFSNDIYQGFASMNEIMILSLLVGGLSGLLQNQGIIKMLVDRIDKMLINRKSSQKYSLYIISAIVSLNDIIIANNTIAILFSGKIAKSISKKHNIDANHSACVLDIFSCVFQGLIPHSPQLLLASHISGIPVITLIMSNYYCMILFVVAIVYIWLIPMISNKV